MVSCAGWLWPLFFIATVQGCELDSPSDLSLTFGDYVTKILTGTIRGRERSVSNSGYVGPVWE